MTSQIDIHEKKILVSRSFLMISNLNIAVIGFSPFCFPRLAASIDIIQVFAKYLRLEGFQLQILHVCQDI